MPVLTTSCLVDAAADAAAEDFGEQVERLGLAVLGGVVGRHHPGFLEARHADARIAQRHRALGVLLGLGRADARRQLRAARHLAIGLLGKRLARSRRRHRPPPPARRCWARSTCRRRRPRRRGSAAPSHASSRSPGCDRDGSGRASRRSPPTAALPGCSRCASAAPRGSRRAPARSPSSVRIRLRMRSDS